MSRTPVDPLAETQRLEAFADTVRFARPAIALDDAEVDPDSPVGRALAARTHLTPCTKASLACAAAAGLCIGVLSLIA